MVLHKRALIHQRVCAERMGFDTDDDPDSLIPLINYASAAIINHVGRPLVFDQNIERLRDSYNDGRIFFPYKPVVSIASVRYDPLRVFGPETEIPYFFDQELEFLIVTQQPRDSKVYRIESSDGFLRVDYNQATPPAAPVSGESWLHGVFEVYDGAAWAPAPSLPMDDSIEGAAAEYVSYIRARMRAGGAGLTKLERGYSFEGSSVSYELSMPQHIKDILEPWTVRAI